MSKTAIRRLFPCSSALRAPIEQPMVSATPLDCWCCRKQVSEFLDTIKAIKPSDISALATKFMKTPLSMASLGDINLVPRYQHVQKRFG